MTDTTLDLTLERIAFRSTRGEGQFAKPRWTELAIYFCHDAPAGTPPFVTEIKGLSIKPGETERRQTFDARSLALAIDYLRDGKGELSTPARLVKAEALQWWEDKGAGLAWKHMHPQQTGVNATPAPVRTYTDEQRAAAMVVATVHIATVQRGTTTRGELVDAIAAALGLTREVAHG